MKHITGVPCGRAWQVEGFDVGEGAREAATCRSAPYSWGLDTSSKPAHLGLGCDTRRCDGCLVLSQMEGHPSATWEMQCRPAFLH